MFKIETSKEEDGRWIAEVIDLPGVMAYGETRDNAISKVQALTLRSMADRLDAGEIVSEVNEFVSAIEPGAVIIYEPWCFKARNTSRKGLFVRCAVTAIFVAAFGLVALFDPGPPFGVGPRAVVRGSVFGFGFGIFTVFLLFDLGSLKRTIFISEDGVSCISTLLGGGVDDAYAKFGNWNRHEISRLELRSPRSNGNSGRDALLRLHPKVGPVACMGVPRQTDLRQIALLIYMLSYPVEVDGRTAWLE